MDSDKLSIMGSASQVAELFSEVEVRSIYGPEAAKLYDIVNRHDTLEIDELLDAAKGGPRAGMRNRQVDVSLPRPRLRRHRARPVA
jgi:hypothetical protein